MEDTSFHLAQALPVDPDERVVHLLRIEQAAVDISSLMSAAQALNHRAYETR